MTDSDQARFNYDLPRAPWEFVGRKQELAFLHDNVQREVTPRTVAVVGPAGIGKSTLVAHYLRQREEKIFWVKASDIRTLGKDLSGLIKDLVHQDEGRPCIVVLDGINESDDLRNYTVEILALRRVYALIVTSRHLGDYLRFPTLNLEGLSKRESFELLGMNKPKRGYNHEYIGDEPVFYLSASVQGNPRALMLIANLLADYPYEQIQAQLNGGWQNLLLNFPVGEQYIVELVAPQIVIANDAMIEMLKKAPQELHRISPRKFEELIADLVKDMGWEIELTPQSKDGGKDILARLKTDLGKILCLIEAKHYRPDRPVQVSLVRQLYGTFVDHGANSAMLVTSSTFTKGASEFQSKHEYQLSLREYDDVVNWIRNYKKKDSPNRIITV